MEQCWNFHFKYRSLVEPDCIYDSNSMGWTVLYLDPGSTGVKSKAKENPGVIHLLRPAVGVQEGGSDGFRSRDGQNHRHHCHHTFSGTHWREEGLLVLINPIKESPGKSKRRCRLISDQLVVTYELSSLE